MDEGMKIITEAFSRYLIGFSLSKAVLEDYAKVVARLENIPEQEVIDRVKKRSDEIFEDAKAKQIQQTEELKRKDSESNNAMTVNDAT